MGIFMHDPVKVLVVANKDDNLTILDALFKDLNCEVIKAFSGNEALKMCLKYDFACVFSVLNLLDMSGFEATKTLCSHERTSNVPVVLLSDSVDDESVPLKAYEVGAVDFILMPVKPYALTPKVKLFIKLYQQRQTLQQQIDQLDKVVHFDPLTHLYNRRQFKGVLEKTHVIAMRYQRRYALLLINIDDFKKLNDTMGHAFGDKVLAVVGKRLRENTRSSDCVAGMGGDNFAVLTPEIKHMRDAGKLASILLDKFKKPFKVDGSEVTLTASIGVVCFPEGDNNVDDLLKKSDIALHKAKKKGKNKFQFFTEKLNEAYIEHVKMCSALDSAIQKNEMFLCYQPQINLKSGKVVGLEVLARWYNSELGDIPPNVFIPLAEETGFIESFGFWVLKEACDQYATWKKSALIAESFLLSINVSPAQLKSTHFLKELLAVVAAHKIPLDNIDFELTESDFSGELEHLENILDVLNEHRITFSIDDFGTSASSLSRLSKMPVGTLKIDQSFVQNIGKNKLDEVTIVSIVTLANSLKLRVLAEGVETEEQLQFLMTHGCAYAQGYYFSKPLSSDDMTAYLSKQ